MINQDTTEEDLGAIDPDLALSALHEAPVASDRDDRPRQLAATMGATNGQTDPTLEDLRETGAPR